MIKVVDRRNLELVECSHSFSAGLCLTVLHRLEVHQRKCVNHSVGTRLVQEHVQQRKVDMNPNIPTLATIVVGGLLNDTAFQLFSVSGMCPGKLHVDNDATDLISRFIARPELVRVRACLSNNVFYT